MPDLIDPAEPEPTLRQRLARWWHVVTPIITDAARALGVVSIAITAYLVILVHDDVSGHTRLLTNITKAGKIESAYAIWLAEAQLAVCEKVQASCPPFPTIGLNLTDHHKHK